MWRNVTDPPVSAINGELCSWWCQQSSRQGKKRGAKKKFKNVMIHNDDPCSCTRVGTHAGCSCLIFRLLSADRSHFLTGSYRRSMVDRLDPSIPSIHWALGHFPRPFLNFNLNTNSGVAHAFLSLVQSSVKKPVGRQSSYHRLPRL